jgi:hypothetical protein
MTYILDAITQLIFDSFGQRRQAHAVVGDRGTDARARRRNRGRVDHILGLG